TFKGGGPVPEGWLVTPHAGDGLTADDVTRIIQQGIAEANTVRAAIRLPLNSRVKMVFAVSDKEGNILGLYRMPDATVFSIDVAGFDPFNPGTNFRDPINPANQNGVVFFPGSSPLYKDVNGDGHPVLVGGLGVSGDGVDQDDDVTYFASAGYAAPPTVARADQ